MAVDQSEVAVSLGVDMPCPRELELEHAHHFLIFRATDDATVGDGVCGTDDFEDSYTYEWTLISRPAGSAASLSGQDAATASVQLIPDLSGDYEVGLVAIDSFGARRAGAQLQTLIIDEGFGTQDTQGRAHLVDAINAIQHDFECILVITHIDELKDEFPIHIEVTKTRAGSAFTVV